jgi:hypothetical protein
MGLSKKQAQMILWRRNRVMELVSKVQGVTEIANTLKMNKSVISKDISRLSLQARESLNKFVSEKLPYQYETCLVGINEILRIAWNETSDHDIERREKAMFLGLAKECYLIKMDLLTNSRILDEAMRFVQQKQKQLQEQQQRQKQPSQLESQQQSEHDQQQYEESDEGSEGSDDDDDSEEKRDHEFKSESESESESKEEIDQQSSEDNEPVDKVF